MNYVFKTTKAVRYRFPTHVNDLVMNRSEAQTSEVFVVVLDPGEAPPMHKHDDTEQIFYVTKGRGQLEIQGERKKFAVEPGDVVRVPPRTFHRIFCRGKKPLEYIAVDCFLGGRPKAEPTWESHVKVICRQQGWDFKKVKQKRK
jgi:mannose-6-phosphate isomerase-like protein (cupin superfamily)